MRYVVEFADASDRAVVGGKGFGLHRLAGWDLNVPPGFVVASSSYEEALGLLGIDVADPDLDAENVAAQFLAANVPDALVDEVAGSLERLEQEHGHGLHVSCRSSATAEDSAAASFAGQFATVLGVSGADGVIDGLRRCWSSAWSTEAVSYRQSNGISHGEVSMAVVVQKMVNASSAGVVFSVNPVTGDAGEVMINSNWGLGESVVSGLVTPDTFLVSKTDRTVTVREISQAKSVAHVMTPDGSVEEKPVGPLEAISPSLTDEQVVEVASLAIAIEEKAGSPQDVEWAYEADVLYVLQTRPITTV